MFLDGKLNIKRYTEQAADLIKLRQIDMGRPLDELATNPKYDHLTDDCREVLKTLVTKAQEVSRTDDVC